MAKEAGVMKVSKKQTVRTHEDAERLQERARKLRDEGKDVHVSGGKLHVEIDASGIAAAGEVMPAGAENIGVWVNGAADDKYSDSYRSSSPFKDLLNSKEDIVRQEIANFAAMITRHRIKMVAGKEYWYLWEGGKYVSKGPAAKGDPRKAIAADKKRAEESLKTLRKNMESCVLKKHKGHVVLDIALFKKFVQGKLPADVFVLSDLLEGIYPPARSREREASEAPDKPYRCPADGFAWTDKSVHDAGCELCKAMKKPTAEAAMLRDTIKDLDATSLELAKKTEELRQLKHPETLESAALGVAAAYDKVYPPGSSSRSSRTDNSDIRNNGVDEEGYAKPPPGWLPIPGRKFHVNVGPDKCGTFCPVCKKVGAGVIYTGETAYGYAKKGSTKSRWTVDRCLGDGCDARVWKNERDDRQDTHYYEPLDYPQASGAAAAGADKTNGTVAA